MQISILLVKQILELFLMILHGIYYCEDRTLER